MLDAVRKSLDGLSPELQAEYKQQDDGTYILDVQAVGGVELADVKNLRSALEKERASASEAGRKVKAFGDLDPEEARRAIAKVAELSKLDPEKMAEEKSKAAIEQVVAQKNREIQAFKDTITKREAQLNSVLVEQRVTQAIQKEKGNSVLLLPHILKHVRMRELEDGNFVPEVLSTEKTARVDGNGNPMTIEQLIAEVKEQEAFAPCFEGSGATGGGAGRGGAGGGGNPPPPPQNKGGKKFIYADDQAAMNANIEGIADGSVTVIDRRGGQ